LGPGNSGHIASPHYDDGVQAWFEGSYHPMLRRREEIEDALEGRLVLEPSAKPAAEASQA
jgi:acyl-homoserine lactone acylase PvdQ